MSNINQDLLTRDKFREACFKRDNYRCIICSAPAIDAHHILERKLFPDQGYYVNNSASLCSDCHLKAEMTLITVEEIRAACGIPETQKILPPHLYDDETYDKWANVILPSGERMKGELFDDPNVQKILEQGNVLHLFTDYVKYPRTWHLPFSPGATKDDRILPSCEIFEGQEVVITVKLDGENTSCYQDYCHARSRADKKHWSKSWVKQFHSQFAHDIPKGWRVILENLYATHSIKYTNLISFAYGISIWNDKNICRSWDETIEWFNLLGIVPVPVLYRGIWDEKIAREIYSPLHNGCECEGFVVRNTREFHYRDFRQNVSKYVRENHVTEKDHWFYGKAGEKNQLAGDATNLG